ncbi:plasma alpha-L-fucosidase-like [Rhynchophorus ferrugineus]
MKLAALLLILASLSHSLAKFDSTWDSLDSREIPSWYDDAKIGIFIHWGVFAVPSFSGEWFWATWKSNDVEIDKYMKANYPPDFSYQEFAKDFTAEFFNATVWADIFAKSGAK